MIDVPGATPSQLVLALGKDGNAYLLNRNNLGGIAAPVAQLSVDGTNQRDIGCHLPHQPGNIFCFSRDGNAVTAYKITPTNPPTIVIAWSVSQTGQGSPWVTTTDGTNNAIVWVVGAQGDQRLHGYNGDTGAVIYAGGGANELMTGTRKWNSGIVARGSIYVANDNKVYAFRVPGGTPTPTPTPTATPLPPRRRLHYTDGHRDCHANIDPNCHGNCESDSDCHSHRFRQSDAYAQTNAHSEIACDTEAAPESAAKAHALTGQYVDCQWFVALTNES